MLCWFRGSFLFPTKLGKRCGRVKVKVKFLTRNSVTCYLIFLGHFLSEVPYQIVLEQAVGKAEIHCNQMFCPNSPLCRDRDRNPISCLVLYGLGGTTVGKWSFRWEKVIKALRCFMYQRERPRTLVLSELRAITGTTLNRDRVVTFCIWDEQMLN